MKKYIMLVIIICFAIFGRVYAQIMDYKYYNDFSGNDGYAVAIYISPNEETVILDRFFKAPGRDLKKLSKRNVWLCWQALNEYDISDGEAYIIGICKDGMCSSEGIVLYVTITDNGKSFTYWGKVLKNPE